MFLASWGALDRPIRSCPQNLNASCEKATPGWPCDKRIEELRDQFARRDSDAAKQKAIAAEIQPVPSRSARTIPLGEWYGQFAYRTSTKGWLPPMTAMLFWNAEKTQYPPLSTPPSFARLRRDVAILALATGQ